MTLTEEFPHVCAYLGTRLGVDLAAVSPGGITVVATDLRLKREMSYGYTRVAWLQRFEDGCAALSVPPEAAEACERIVDGREAHDLLDDRDFERRLAKAVDRVTARHGLPPVNRTFRDVCYACNAKGLIRLEDPRCLRLRDTGIPAIPELDLPEHCFPDGIVYAIVIDGLAVSIAHAHTTGVMEDRVADLSVPGTAKAHRRKGYGKIVVAAVVDHVARHGGEGYYVCRPDNDASVATARSVGFIPFGASLVLGSFGEPA